MQIKLLDLNIKPKVSIVGHAGCGHCHSNNQFTQDDTGGFLTTVNLLQRATGIDLTIKDVAVVTGVKGSITVTLSSGGTSTTYPRRGVTFHEAEQIKNLIGKDAKFIHTITLEIFGRYYGQGVSECAVSMQIAIAKAVFDSFMKQYPNNFVFAKEDVKNNIGSYIGTIADINGTPTAIMSIINATEGGIGPNEDLEGNGYVLSKKTVMESLNMIDIPTITVEGKVYSSALCDTLADSTFLIRADDNDDNPYIAKAMYDSAKGLGYSTEYNKNALKRTKNALQSQTEKVGQLISDKGLELAKAMYSHEKVEIIAQLAELISHDCGGVSFMSNKLHEIIGGPGLMPATTAVISLLITKEERDAILFPYLTNKDCEDFTDIVINTIPFILDEYDDVCKHIATHKTVQDLDLLTKTV